jgi:hypothetical protein
MLETMGSWIGPLRRSPKIYHGFLQVSRVVLRQCTQLVTETLECPAVRSIVGDQRGPNADLPRRLELACGGSQRPQGKDLPNPFSSQERSTPKIGR